MYFIKYLILIVLFLCSCIMGAGQNVIRCYTRFNMDESSYAMVLRRIWEKYPEIRLNNLNKIKMYKLDSFFINKNLRRNDTSIIDQDYFKEIHFFPGWIHNYWYFKSESSEIGYQIWIASCNYKNSNCHICLKSIIFLDTISRIRMKSVDLTRKEKKYVQKKFENDILKKIEEFIKYEGN